MYRISFIWMLLLLCKLEKVWSQSQCPSDYQYVPKKLPYIATVVINNVKNCGGAILDNYSIATSARCVTDEDGIVTNSAINVVVGMEYVDGKVDTALDVIVDKILTPTKYNKDTHAGDIAVLKLNNSLETEKNSNFRAVKLANSNNADSSTNKNVYITGLGWDELVISRHCHTNSFQNVSIKKNSKDNFVNIGIIKKDACKAQLQGETGALLMSEDETLEGIITFNDDKTKCQESSDVRVFTKVSSYSDFLIKAMNNIDDPTTINTKKVETNYVQETIKLLKSNPRVTQEQIDGFHNCVLNRYRLDKLPPFFKLPSRQ